MLSEIPKQHLARPFLKWAGGKSRLIQQYIPYFPADFKTYYEPFLGGGAVFFYLHYHQPTKAILTDINSELITTYLCVKNRVDELINLLKEHERQHNQNKKEHYYKVRATSGETDIQQASRLIYLNKTCFNGLYRVNSQGKFNVPLGRYENPKICQEDLLRSASKALQWTDIQQADFAEAVRDAKSSDDFVFFDPPYYPISNTSYFTAYNRNSFNEKDQKRLRDTCASLASRGVKVMVCNSNCEFIRKIYTEINFNIYLIEASRSINSNIKKRGMIYELLITSY
ncbi:DNA methyltransferase [Nostocales cyanobacterium HT-58-2]|nr:DNA methyltransferase [Nostocales cyanobacterium HT-58-2]